MLMTPCLRRLDPSKITPGARQRTLDAMEAYRKADEEIKRICAEKGIPVPVLVC